jgi:hypothetical protein
MTIYSIIEDIDQDNRTVQDSDSVTEWTIKQKTIAAIKRLYHDADFTVRDICTVYGIEYKPEYQKLFFKLFGSKGKGHGGARRSNSKL